MVDPVKIFLSSTLTSVLNLVAVTACAYVGGPKNMGGAGPLSLGMEGIDDHRKYITPTCVTLLNLVALDQTVWT